MIIVEVGPKRKRYHVHKALLTRYEWFSKRISYYTSVPAEDPADKAVSRSYISVPAEDPKVFELLISWLYRKSLKAISTADEEVAMEEAELSVRMYLRACEWDMHELQNALIDRVRVRTTCVYGCFPQQLIKTIYEKTEPTSPLRSYIVDSFIYKGIEWDEEANIEAPIAGDDLLTRKSALKTQLDAGNQTFVLDCYEALFQLCAKSKIRDPDRRTGCVYHTHEEGEECLR